MAKSSRGDPPPNPPPQGGREQYKLTADRDYRLTTTVLEQRKVLEDDDPLGGGRAGEGISQGAERGAGAPGGGPRRWIGARLVAVIGSSGSGKSTLLHVLGLLDTPGSRVMVYGLTAARIDNGPDRRRDALRNQTFGFIFQFYHLLPELTALENVMLPHLIRHGVLAYWSIRKKVRRDATILLERVGLGHRLDHKPIGAFRRRNATHRDRPRPGSGGPGNPAGRRADRQPRRRHRPGGSGAFARLEPRTGADYDDGHSRPPDRPASRPGRPARRGPGSRNGPRRWPDAREGRDGRGPSPSDFAEAQRRGGGNPFG